jgi:hypothetical protein
MVSENFLSNLVENKKAIVTLSGRDLQGKPLNFGDFLSGKIYAKVHGGDR